MFQDTKVGFRELMLSWRISTLLWWIFTVRFWARYLLSRHQRHFSGHVLDSCWALKSYLRIALPSTTCFFHMQSPHRVSMSQFVYNHRADRIPLSAPLSAQGLSYWAPADPDSQWVQLPRTFVWSRKSFLVALLFTQLQASFPSLRKTHDNPSVLCRHHNFSQKYFRLFTACPLRNSSQLSSELLKTLKTSVTDPSLCPVCTASCKENCFISFSTQISYWFLLSAVMLNLLCHHLVDDLPPSCHS